VVEMQNPFHPAVIHEVNAFALQREVEGHDQRLDASMHPKSQPLRGEPPKTPVFSIHLRRIKAGPGYRERLVESLRAVFGKPVLNKEAIPLNPPGAFTPSIGWVAHFAVTERRLLFIDLSRRRIIKLSPKKQEKYARLLLGKRS
jgi:hypothetical protein